MRKVHEKSILLGIGIGMIITAIAGMIFSAGTQKELSKEEIISIAKAKYGLIEQVQFLNGDNASNDSTNSSTSDSSAQSTAAQSTATVGDSVATDKQQVDKSSSSAITERNIIIEINDGYKSQEIIDQLFEKEVISNKEEFTNVLNSYGVTKKIRVGTFKFRKNDDLDYIVKTICKLK